MHSSFSVLKKRQAAKPNGHWIYAFSVTKVSSSEVTIKMSPAKCGDHIPLLDIVGARKTHGVDETSFHFTEFNSAITVTRKRAASPPITGTYDILYQNKKLQGKVRMHRVDEMEV